MSSDGSGGEKRRFLTQDQIDRALEQVAATSRREGIHATLIGGLAMQIYGSDRMTADVDVAADAMPRSGPFEIVQPLTFGGASTRTPEGTAVDFVVRTDDFADVYEEAIKHRAKVEGVPVHVAPAEYLVVMKMIAGRERDEGDVRRLALSGALDMKRTEKLLKRLLGRYAVQAFRRLVEEAQWLRDQGRL